MLSVSQTPGLAMSVTHLLWWPLPAASGDTWVYFCRCIERSEVLYFTRLSCAVTNGSQSNMILVPHDTNKIVRQIWDTQGQERFKSISASYYKGARVAVIVYDATDMDSFETLRQVPVFADTHCHALALGADRNLSAGWNTSEGSWV